MRLTNPDDAIVAIAGLPGAGRSTLIRHAVNPSVVRVVDTDDQRREGGRASHVRHYARILRAVWGPRPVVIHMRRTVGTLRRSITLVASLRGRPGRPYRWARRAPTMECST